MSSARWSVAALAIALTVSSVTVASAQQRGPGGRGMMAPGADALMILNQESVQKELKLTDAQTTVVREAGDEFRSTMAGMRDMSQEERREARGKTETKVKELRGKIDSVLDAAQKERLKQLTLQRRGVLGAIQDPEVATALKITDDQKKKIDALVEEMRGGRGQGGGGGGGGAGGDREAFRERLAKALKERDEKASAILTAEQKTELEKLQGAKFEFPAGRGAPGA